MELPHDDEAERGVLGCCLLSPLAAEEALSLLSEEDFYDPSRREVFKAVRDLYAEGKEPDLILASSLLKERGELEKLEGGAAFLADLLASSPLPANAREYASLVLSASKLRKVVALGMRIEQLGLSCHDGREACLKAQEEALSLASAGGKGELESVGEAALSLAEGLKGAGPKALPTGFKELDGAMQGFLPGQLVIVAGRPGMGKSTLASDFARHACLSSPVALFSLEMGKEEVAGRILCAQEGLRFESVQRGRLEGQEELEKLQEGLEALSKMPIFIDDSADLGMMELRAKCGRLKRQKGLGLVIVDYLQLLSPSGRAENRQQEISGFSRALKVMAKELEVPVVALSQLNRGPEMREGKRPQLSDLRESGSLEQDADIVMFVTRPEAYDPDDRPGEAELIVAKRRNGKTGSFPLRFEGEFSRFSDPSPSGF